MAKRKFPKSVFVEWQEYSSNPRSGYWLLQEASDSCDDGRVGIYQLQEVVVKTTESVLEPE